MYLKEIMAKHPGLKVYCSGHSLGGLVAALVTGRMQKDLAGMLLFS
jgi:alpha-beta hydrolase superfamily lysophospholipase